jgi:hypothetical protein
MFGRERRQQRLLNRPLEVRSFGDVVCGKGLLSMIWASIEVIRTLITNEPNK